MGRLDGVFHGQAFLVHEQQHARRAGAVGTSEAMHKHAPALSEGRVDEGKVAAEELGEVGGIGGDVSVIRDVEPQV